MIISKRQYYCNYLLMITIMGVLIFIGAPIANRSLVKCILYINILYLDSHRKVLSDCTEAVKTKRKQN